MSPRQRIALLALAVVVIVAAIIVIPKLGDDDEGATATATRTAIAVTQPAPGTGTVTAVTTVTGPAPVPAPPTPPLLQPGSVRTITVKRGDPIRFRVRSPTADTVHVHGYDREYEVAPGKTLTVGFPATIEGAFEIELHHDGGQIGRLVVEPQ